MSDAANDERAEVARKPARWAKVIDHSRCIGCHACTTACKSENLVPIGVNRTYVKYVDVGVFPQARRAFQVTRCNQCSDAPCAKACPTGAMYARPDGIVDFDKSICIGCKACMAACPYDAIFINPDDHSAEKCNFCAHRLEVGLEPACVVVCPTEAIAVGDLEDPGSRVAHVVHREPVSVRRPEKDTRPKLFYKGAHQATLDPIAAERPTGGIFMWSEQPAGPHMVTSGHPSGLHNSSAAAILAYDVPHRAPWDWRVSFYTFTKSLAAGAYLVPALFVLLGWLSPASVLWRWLAPVTAGAFLAATGVLLLWDLEHPERFHLIFTRGRAQSWLVRGAWIITTYGLLLAAHLAASVAGAAAVHRALVVPGAVLALFTAVYTAYLFSQAKGRDLWQSALLPPHLTVQAVLMGAAVLAFGAAVSGDAVTGVSATWVFAGAAALHLGFVLGEVTQAHPTAHARLAVGELTRGRYSLHFWTGVALGAVGLASPWLGLPAMVVAALGLLAYEHAYVQSAQAVPLA